MQFSLHRVIAKAALEGVCQRLAVGDLSGVLSAGITVEEVNELKRLSFPEWQFIVQQGSDFIKVDIDHVGLRDVLERVGQVRAEEEQRDMMLRMMAPLPMMRVLFGMHSNEYSNRRKLLGIPGACTGRPPACNKETESNILSIWNDTAHISPMWLRYVTVAEITEKQLNVIWRVVSRVETAEPGQDTERKIAASAE